MPDLTDTGHLTDDAATELRRLLVQGTRLRVTVTLQEHPMAQPAAALELPADPARLANALQSIADVLDPRTTAPGREEPLEAPELAATLAAAYEALHGVVPDDSGAYLAQDAEADALLAALGAVLASAYLEGRRA